MNANVIGCLNNINKAWKAFEHRGKPMTKNQVKNILLYAKSRGMKTTNELTDIEVDNIIKHTK